MRSFLTTSMKRGVATMVLGLVCAVAASEASAQFIVTGPDGSLGIQNPGGSYTYIYPGRLNPAANMVIPGSSQMTPWGNIWLGWDGQIHGNLVDPSTGDIHLRMQKKGRSAPPNSRRLNRPLPRRSR